MTRTVVFLDLDRTIFNTNLFFEDILQAMEDVYGKEYRSAIKARLDETYRQTGAASLVSAGVTAQELERLAERAEQTVIQQNPHRYWYEDVADFLEKLLALGKTAIILTSGRGTTQQLKLRLANFELPSVIVDQPQKSRWIADNYLIGGGTW